MTQMLMEEWHITVVQLVECEHMITVQQIMMNQM